MSLGILKVAAVLEAAGWLVEVADFSGVADFEKRAAVRAACAGAKYFGITATTAQMPAAKKIANAIRFARPDAKIILGGAHVTSVNAAYKKEKKRGVVGRAFAALQILHKYFDVLVAGDGEEAIFEAVLEESSRLVDADDPQSKFFLCSHKLNSLPYPARHLVDVGSYSYYIEGEWALSVILQLGCPFGCGFCCGRNSPFLRHVRLRSISDIIGEFRHIYEVYGLKGFMVYDDELNVNKGMIELMMAIKAAQKSYGVGWKLRGFIKAELFNDEQAEALAEAGFRCILLGFESGSQRILGNINKRASLKDNILAMQTAHKHGLKVKALMSIGHPGESLETAVQTYNWILEAQPDDFDVTIITAYPGAPYYDDAVMYEAETGVWVYTSKSTGDRLYSLDVDYTEVAEYYKGHPDREYQSYVYTDYLNREDLVALRDMIEGDARKKLSIPFPSAQARYDHSMGQAGKM